MLNGVEVSVTEWPVIHIDVVFLKRILYQTCFISKMYFSLWKTPGVSERMWSVNLEASISGEYQTLGGYSGRPSE
jgi:hypothetical protein